MGGLLKIVEDIENEAHTFPEDQFWRVKRNAKNANLYVVLPDSLGFVSYLESLGVCFESKSNELVRYDNGIVSKIEISELKRIVQKDIRNFPDVNEEGITKDEILKMVMANEARLFKVKGLLEFLNLKEFNWVKSNKDTGYFFYKNGVVEVKATGIELIPYKKIEGHIWDTQIIDRDFELVDTKKSNWRDFIFKAAGETKDLLANFNAALGYILHTFKDSGKAYLVVLGEAVADSNLGGGSGKSLTGVGISHIVPTQMKDMRQYSPSDAFKWSMVKQDTEVLVLSDLTQHFDHTLLYNMLTGEMEINAKNQPLVIYPFEESPKILATTNYSLSDEAGHGNRRLRLVEYSQFWHEGNTPDKYYGKLFFSDWSLDEWKQFDSYMLLTVRHYLKNGFPKIKESEGSKRKRIIGNDGMLDLIEWLQGYSTNEYSSFSNLYLDYSNSKYVTGKLIGKNVFIKRIEDAISIMPSRNMETAENGNVKSYRIS